jgi:hypothetical protein
LFEGIAEELTNKKAQPNDIKVYKGLGLFVPVRQENRRTKEDSIKFSDPLIE